MRQLKLIAVLIAVAIAVTAAAANGDSERRVKVMRFDVAEDFTRFAFAPSPVDGDGQPAYGNAFVTQGYIYPQGTLDGADGVLDDGRPQFPGKVLGEWTCRGYFIGDGAKTKRGPWVVTSQLFQLGERFGRTTITTEGYERPQVDVRIARAVTGGTGTFDAARGEQTQTMLGFGTGDGVKLRTTLTVRGS